jgi:hypothetical protein
VADEQVERTDDGGGRGPHRRRRGQVQRQRADRTAGSARLERRGGCCGRCGSRQARTTSAPWARSSRAVWKPSPVLAPVTSAVRPRWSPMSSSIHIRRPPGSGGSGSSRCRVRRTRGHRAGSGTASCG